MWRTQAWLRSAAQLWTWQQEDAGRNLHCHDPWARGCRRLHRRLHRKLHRRLRWRLRWRLEDIQQHLAKNLCLRCFWLRCTLRRCGNHCNKLLELACSTSTDPTTHTFFGLGLRGGFGGGGSGSEDSDSLLGSEDDDSLSTTGSTGFRC